MNQLVLTILIITLVYFFIFTNRRLRTTASFLGAIIIVFIGIISFDTAVSYIDFTKLGIIIGVMILTIIAKDSGIFQYLAIRMMRYSNGKAWTLFVLLSILTGLLSSIFDEITTLLFMTNITLAITSILEISSVPFLIAQIIFANIGGMATYLGSPTNIMIGSSANFCFFDFIYHIAPIAIILTIVNIYYFKIVFGKEMSNNKIPDEIINNFDKINEKECIVNPPLFRKTLIVTTAGIVFALFSHILQIDLVVIILLAGFTLLFITPDKSIHSIYAQIDWAIIFFIIGLNVLAGTLEEHGIINILSRTLLSITEGNTLSINFLFLAFNTFFSSFLDNIPIINLAIPIAKHIIKEIPVITPVIWITMIIAANIGANGTLIGTASNLIVAEIAEKNNQRINFWYFFRVGFPLVIIHFIISFSYIYLRYLA
ncbi:MAG: SLC13 family permease [Atribacterota bacterium]|nr:SLC13 family permease [Atribacterota bacterium]